MIELDGKTFEDADALYLHGLGNGKRMAQGRIDQLELLCIDMADDLLNDVSYTQDDKRALRARMADLELMEE